METTKANGYNYYWLLNVITSTQKDTSFPVYTLENRTMPVSLSRGFRLLNLPPFPYRAHSIMINKLFIPSCH